MKQKAIISSRSNDQIKKLSLLQKKAKERAEQGLFVVEGIKMLEEAMEAGLLNKAYVSESFYQEKLQTNPNYLKNMEYEIITDPVFNEVSDTKTPQGILGTVKIIRCQLERILQNPKGCLLFLEDIRDPGNLGTIIRTAEGAGVTGVVLTDTSVDIYNPKVIRATMGSIYRVPFIQTKNFYEVLRAARYQGVEIYAAHLQGIPYDNEGSFKKKCAFLIGNEANGLTNQASELADTLIKIPMAGKVESLNAAVAAAILMYEAARQRRNE